MSSPISSLSLCLSLCLSLSLSHKQTLSTFTIWLCFFCSISTLQGLSIRLTSQRTVLGKASPSISSLGDQLVNGTNCTDTVPSDQSVVSGINLTRQNHRCYDSRTSQYNSEVENGKVRGKGKEQFIVIGSDSSIARYVLALLRPFSILLSLSISLAHSLSSSRCPYI